ncbi:MAG TPA: hypothetical protein V6D13_10230 [Halomicronema sp.]
MENPASQNRPIVCLRGLAMVPPAHQNTVGAVSVDGKSDKIFQINPYAFLQGLTVLSPLTISKPAWVFGKTYLTVLFAESRQK